MTDTTPTSETCSLLPAKRARSVSVTSPTSEPDLKCLKYATNSLGSSEPLDSLRLPMKRRVNPDSLASRLEPALVQEMDALILLGNSEMPSFAVRKDLQERYQIDRRHIYDYFHSKGLRVVRHDKLSNLTRKLDGSCAMRPRPIRQAPQRELHTSLEKTLKCDSSAPRSSLGRTGRAKKPRKILPHHASVRTFTHRATLLSSSPAFSEASDVNAVQQRIEIEEDVNDDPISPVCLLDEEFSLTRTICNIPCSYSAQDFFDPVPRPHDPQKGNSDCATHFTPYSTVCDGNLFPPLGYPLSRTERLAMYKFLDSNIRPACGIEESVGSYKSYMKERSRRYYERLFKLPGMIDTPREDGSHRLASIAQDPVDFKKWLLCIPSKNSSNVSRSEDLPTDEKGSLLPCTPPRKPGKTSRDSWAEQSFRFAFSPPVYKNEQTLDTLFPQLSPPNTLTGLNMTMGSPVARSRVAESPSLALEDESECLAMSSLLLAESRSPFQRKLTSKVSTSQSLTTTRSCRLRTGRSGYNNLGQIPTLTLTETSDRGKNAGPRFPCQTFSPVIDQTSPALDPKRFRSQSFSGRPRTISAGGGI